ncbi:MAG: hypothetical protein ACR2M7_03555 [Bdellovibrionales bacterium]
MKWSIFILLFSIQAYGDTKPLTESSVKYAKVQKKKRNMKRKKNSSFFNKNSDFILYSGTSLFKESKEGHLPAFSSFRLGFQKSIIELSSAVDFELQMGIQSVRLETERATGIEMVYRFSTPSMSSEFPIYIGAGLGYTLFPRRKIKSLPSESTTSIQFFTGVRFLEVFDYLDIIAEINLKITDLDGEKITVNTTEQSFLYDKKTEIDKRSYYYKYLEIFGNLGIVFNF